MAQGLLMIAAALAIGQPHAEPAAASNEVSYTQYWEDKVVDFHCQSGVATITTTVNASQTTKPVFQREFDFSSVPSFRDARECSMGQFSFSLGTDLGAQHPHMDTIFIKLNDAVVSYYKIKDAPRTVTTVTLSGNNLEIMACPASTPKMNCQNSSVVIPYSKLADKSPVNPSSDLSMPQVAEKPMPTFEVTLESGK